MNDPTSPTAARVGPADARVSLGPGGSFLGAYLLAEEDGSRNLHVMFATRRGPAGVSVAVGFVGSTHARFRDFAYGRAPPWLSARPRPGSYADYEGHNPAGSWAIYACSRWPRPPRSRLAQLQSGRRRHLRGDHEVLANAWLVMVVVHVAGVIVASLAHRRNLVVAMITGRRRGGSATAAGGEAAPGHPPASAGRDGRSVRHSRGGARLLELALTTAADAARRCRGRGGTR